jgi:hypothetical protein
MPHLMHVPFQFLGYYSVFLFICFCAAGVRLSSGLCWFIPGVAVEIPCATYLLTCWSASPKHFWSWHLAPWEPSCFLSVTWYGEVLLGWDFRLSEFCFFLMLFSAKCGSSVSAKFLIYGAHTVCFLHLVTILDPLPMFLRRPSLVEICRQMLNI